ncbi:MAG: hypothetical protein AB8G16_00535 [Gammaproteobacteria bacterium]
MIYALRRRHRTMIWIAAISIPLILYFALRGRTAAITDATPLITRNIPALGTVLMGEHTLRLSPASKATQLQIAVFSESGEGTPWTLSLTHNGQPSPGPDVLIYWQQDNALKQLATDAILLGPYLGQGGNHFALPVNQATGSVVLYSLAHQDVLGASTLLEIVEES